MAGRGVTPLLYRDRMSGRGKTLAYLLDTLVRPGEVVQQ